MGRVEEWTSDLIETGTEFKNGVLAGLDTPAYLVEAATYDPETAERDEPYSMRGRLDMEQEYTGSEDDWVYETGRKIGAAGPTVAFLGTANPMWFSVHGGSVISAANAAYHTYLED